MSLTLNNSVRDELRDAIAEWNSDPAFDSDFLNDYELEVYDEGDMWYWLRFKIILSDLTDRYNVYIGAIERFAHKVFKDQRVTITFGGLMVIENLVSLDLNMKVEDY